MTIFQSMKLISLTLLYSLTLSHAKPILPRNANSTTIAFQLTASHSGPDGINVHLSSLVANGGVFWIESIAKETSSYCPLEDRTQCPPSELTEFRGRAGLGEIALVDCIHSTPLHSPSFPLIPLTPPSQATKKIYVTANGALRFTPAHSGTLPTGSRSGPFNISLNSDPTRPSGFRYAGPGARVDGWGFYACSKGGKGKGPYQVFVNLEGLGDRDVLGGCLEECIGFGTLFFEGEGGKGGAAAWEYV